MDENKKYNKLGDCCKLTTKEVKFASNSFLRMLLEELEGYKPSKNREYSIKLVQDELKIRKII